MNLILPYPPSINRTYKSGWDYKNERSRFYKSQEATEWMDAAWYTIKSKQEWRHKMIGERVTIAVYWWSERASDRPDVDFCVKPVLDILQKAGIIENDNVVDCLKVVRLKAKNLKERRVEVDILE